MRPAVFLDRDGTINHDLGYTIQPEAFHLIDGVRDALCRLKRAGYRLIVVTNQSGIGRGYFDAAAVDRLHAYLNGLLCEEGRIDAFYYASCVPGQPNSDAAALRMRKPDIGMFEAACRDQAIDVSRSWMVGDRKSDLEFGRRAGLRTILVATGDGVKTRASLEPSLLVSADAALAREATMVVTADHHTKTVFVPSLREAADVILDQPAM